MGRRDVRSRPEALVPVSNHMPAILEFLWVNHVGNSRDAIRAQGNPKNGAEQVDDCGKLLRIEDGIFSFAIRPEEAPRHGR